MRSLYHTYLRLWQQGYGNAGFSPRLPDYATRYWLDQLQAAVAHPLIRSFLDIGAGDGRLSMLLLSTTQAQGAAVEVAFDDRAWQPITSAYPQFELHRGLLQDYVASCQGKRQFDLVLLAEVFEHIPPSDIPLFLKHLYTMVADGGKVFLTTPNRVVMGPAEQSPIWHEREPYGHHKHYTYQELAALLSAAGFVVEWHCFECHRFKSWLYNRWLYPLSRLDARLLFSKKIPAPMRTVYRWLSLPAIGLARAWFWLLAQAVYVVEKRLSNERTAQTMMLVIKKQS
jgi:2-polyprenyl-3-methyl-5-hydroxy-6-metoxy-1,4-benzoquinol methylase